MDDKIKKKKPSYFSILIAGVRYDKDLVPNAKLLYSEITALAESEGYCNTSNEYFAELYGVKKRTISNWITQLVEKGYIAQEIDRDDKGQIIKRRLYVNLTIYFPIPEIKGEI